MALTPWRGSAILLCLLAAGCSSLPRGAGFEAEVIKSATEAEKAGEVAPFQVVEVTRATHDAMAEWPKPGLVTHSWPSLQGRPSSMILQPGDKIDVTVWNTEDNSLLSGVGQRSAQVLNARVAADGSVFLPFLGGLDVQGKTTEEVRDLIEQEYAYSIPSAQVQIVVTPGLENTANVVAGVSAPGVYPLEQRNTSVLTLLSMAGGVQGALNNPQLRLMRGGTVFGISMARLYENAALDTTIMGGDRIVVEADQRTFLSLGAAGSEAVHHFPTDDLTALEALSVIGGVTDERANPQGILILRTYPENSLRTNGTGPTHEQVVFTLNLTTAEGLFSAGEFQILPDDLVYVTETPVTTARTIMGLLGSAFGLANQVN